jgi:membrane protease YdiL (CAAX protease family)
MVLLHPEAGPWLLGRSLVWNTLLGGVYGWLFWKRSLEAAMLAHASTHVGMVAMRALLA